MEDINLEQLWKEHNQELSHAKLLNLQSWAVNCKTFEYLQTHKAQSKLKSLAIFKGWAVFLGILWVLFLGVLVYGNHFTNIYFSTSVLMILLFSVFAIGAYIRQIVLINQINLSGNVVEVQEKLTQLKASTINTIRILWLQLPFYTTFFWNSKWMSGDIKFWLIAFPITVSFTLIAIWLCRNIAYRNAHKKWFRILLGNKEWGTLVKAIDYLKEIEAFKGSPG
jgi:hypothetical protein